MKNNSFKKSQTGSKRPTRAWNLASRMEYKFEKMRNKKSKASHD
ncbi:MAG: hypothetical protein PHP03_01260 [Candidatus Pacebacteria bacterium]|nr:hypothetical protein [Candidatus Paceibacterota bacterium]